MIDYIRRLQVRDVNVKIRETDYLPYIANYHIVTDPTVINVVLVSLFLTLNIFQILFWCFHGRLRTSKCRLGIK